MTLDPEETLHLARVLRLGVGAQVEVCDGEGGNFAAQVATLEPRGATLRILGKLDALGRVASARGPGDRPGQRVRPWTRPCARPPKWG